MNEGLVCTSAVEAAEAVERMFPGVEISRGLEVDELWRLYAETGFLYPEKLAAMEPHLGEVRRTIERLLKQPEGGRRLMETVVARREGELAGHLCSLRAYRKTWVVQHLAALRRLGSSAVLNQANAHFTQLRTDIEWLRMSFRPENSVPMRAFGAYARQVQDQATSVMREMGYWVSAAPHAKAPRREDTPRVLIAAGGASDCGFIEEWFRQKGRMAEFHALDLDGDLQLAAIGAEFYAVGLERGRKILVAWRGGHYAGFALCEFASRGMNLSELTNAMTVHADDGVVAEALLQAGREFYAARGAERVIVLDDGAHDEVLLATGFAKKRTYATWTFHRKHVEGAIEHFEKLFARVRRERLCI